MVAGAASLEYRASTFLFANATAADPITAADIGHVCFLLDDQTVERTDRGATRSRAGSVDAVEAIGVWVRCDEAPKH